MPTEWAADTGSFLLLAFPALFSIINPLGGAFVFLAATKKLSEEARTRLARQIAIYSFIILSVSMTVGVYVLKFFGISMPVLRLAGGIIIALSAWTLLNADDEGKDRGAALETTGSRDVTNQAFYPLTMPITTGPGTISVAIALGTGGASDVNPLIFVLQTGVATTLMCLLIYLLYRSSNQISRAIGPNGTSIVARLSAFLLFCIGIQVMWTGIAELVASLPASS